MYRIGQVTAGDRIVTFQRCCSMMQPFRIAVFASGSGTNFQAIVDAVASGKLDVIVELLVCDRPQARG